MFLNTPPPPIQKKQTKTPVAMYSHAISNGRITVLGEVTSKQAFTQFLSSKTIFSSGKNPPGFSFDDLPCKHFSCKNERMFPSWSDPAWKWGSGDCLGLGTLLAAPPPLPQTKHCLVQGTGWFPRLGSSRRLHRFHRH